LLTNHYFLGASPLRGDRDLLRLRYRSGPACGVAATHPSNPLRIEEKFQSSEHCKTVSGALKNMDGGPASRSGKPEQ
jgi:hypothetical protein